jgi:hypothetical protein
MAIYDEAGAMTRERWNRIEAELKGGAGGLDREGMAPGLVYCALTELLTDGLLRPGEGLPQTGFISYRELSFERDASGKLKSCTVMIAPIKRRGKNVFDSTKKPTLIKANRVGSLRTAELLDILNTVPPCRAGEEKTTPAIRFPVERMEGLNWSQSKSLSNPTMRKVTASYYVKCKAAGVHDSDLVKPHSFRIAGATLLFAMGVTAEEIKTMGRWFSDCYRLYTRLTKERLVELSTKVGEATTTQFANGPRGFFGTVLDAEPVEKAGEAAETGESAVVASEEDGEISELSEGSGSGSMPDDELERRCGTTPRDTGGSSVPIEDLFEGPTSDNDFSPHGRGR